MPSFGLNDCINCQFCQFIKRFVILLELPQAGPRFFFIFYFYFRLFSIVDINAVAIYDWDDLCFTIYLCLRLLKTWYQDTWSAQTSLMNSLEVHKQPQRTTAALRILRITFDL